jgi:hypothetical protein
MSCPRTNLSLKDSSQKIEDGDIQDLEQIQKGQGPKKALL